MKISKQTALKLWEERYGDSIKVTDYAGRPMFMGDYNNRNSEHGWNIDHKLPKDRNGTDEKNNLVICNILTNDEKANKTTFVANGKRFQVQKMDDGYAICPHLSNPKYYENQEIWYSFFDNEVEVDFANREIHYEDFQNEDSEYGWDVCFINTQISDIENNLIVANIETIKEKCDRNSFVANGYKFQIFKNAEGEYKFFSPDIIADKYDVSSVLKYVDAEDKNIFLCYTIMDLTNVRKYRNNKFKYTLDKLTKLMMGIAVNFNGFVRLEISNNFLVVYFEIEDKSEVRELMDFNVLVNTYKVIYENSIKVDIDVMSDIIEILESDKFKSLDVLLENLDSMKVMVDCANSQNTSTMYIGESLKNNMDINQYKMREYKSIIGQLGRKYSIYECNYTFERIEKQIQNLD